MRNDKSSKKLRSAAQHWIKTQILFSRNPNKNYYKLVEVTAKEYKIET
jgi:hypothetical protein